MKYLRIASVSRTNSTDMFTLGVSTSRGTDKIGQFGSGSLMGSLCWMRHEGDSPIFGLNGSRVEFECQLTKKTNGEPFRRVFQIENGERHPLSVSLEYGEIDWPNPEMGLREWISNALDHGADLSEALTVVDESEIDFPEEMVVVYVPMSGTVRKYWQNIDSYFLHFTESQTQEYIVKEKATPCRVYRRGVFIRQMEFNSICDYNLDFDINESRNGSSDSIRTTILKYVNHPPDGRERYVQHIFSAVLANKDCIEVRENVWYSTLFGPWDEFLKGRTELVHNGIDGAKGYHVTSQWYEWIVRSSPDMDGMKEATKAIKEGFIIVPTPKLTQKVAQSIWETIELIGLTNGKQMPNIQVFKTKDGSVPGLIGAYEKKNQTVSLWEGCENSKEILFHEMAHHASGANDCTRAFEEYLIRANTELMKLAFG